MTWSSQRSPSLFPEQSPWDHSGCNVSCCYSYNSLPLISICPRWSALPSHFCSCPFKVWEHQRISWAASGFTSSPPFSSAAGSLGIAYAEWHFWASQSSWENIRWKVSDGDIWPICPLIFGKCASLKSTLYVLTVKLSLSYVNMSSKWILDPGRHGFEFWLYHLLAIPPH